MKPSKNSLLKRMLIQLWGILGTAHFFSLDNDAFIDK
jgi:hypothetical protein